jgi:hypothetical protein
VTISHPFPSNSTGELLLRHYLIDEGDVAEDRDQFLKGDQALKEVILESADPDFFSAHYEYIAFSPTLDSQSFARSPAALNQSCRRRRQLLSACFFNIENQISSRPDRA